MNILNGRAKELMKIIDQSIQSKDYGDGYTLENDGYMNLSIHKMYEMNGEGNYQFSIAHTSELNGDLMQDPEVGIIKLNGEYIPYYFRNDYAGHHKEHVRVVEGTIVSFNPHGQKDLTKFMKLWLGNLKAQGFIKLIQDKELLCK